MDQPRSVDLHAHYPIHIPGVVRFGVLDRSTAALARLVEADVKLPKIVKKIIMWILNHLLNYEHGHPAVTDQHLRDGHVDVALSVLIYPFAEMDLPSYGDPPSDDYFGELEAQVKAVEKHVKKQRDIVIVHNQDDLKHPDNAAKVKLIHAVEGGFHFGSTPEKVRTNVAKAADEWGLGSITVAHLLWRQVASNAPGFPFLSDQAFHDVFDQAEGLTALGRALIEAMVDKKILIDITHMDQDAIRETFAMLDELDPGPDHKVPVMATHSACRFGGREYKLTDDNLREIKKRDGVVGLIACKHWMADTFAEPRTFAQSMNLMFEHINHMQQELPGDDYQTPALGSDFDGFIKPVLPGFDGPQVFPDVWQALRVPYGEEAANRICRDNARRVLKYWRGRTIPTARAATRASHRRRA